ncbi:MAG: hypothetical protein WCK58_07390 [Chloroflexota bacterium]
MRPLDLQSTSVTLARRLRRRPVVLLATALLVLATTGVAVAVTAWAPGPNGVINGCRNASTGVLRLLSGTATACKAGEQRVSWERSGNLRSGRTAPAAGLGIAGDFYLDTLALRLYGPKAAAGWGGGAPLAGGAGKDGNTVLSGTGDPGAGTGADGDFYLATDTMTMWGPKAAGAWPGSGTGLAKTGNDGATILSGPSYPGPDVGAEGDFYLQTIGNTLYGPKTGSNWGWGTTLAGMPGVPGAPGAQGPQGATGLSTGRFGFSLSTVDTAGDVGQFASIAIGADGLGLISYYDAGAKSLKIAHCADVPCTSATSATLDSGGDVGKHTSITIGADGLGLIAYYDATNEHLKVAHCSDTACSTAALSTHTASTLPNAGAWSSITLGADGLGLISSYNAALGHPSVTHCSDVACSAGDSITYVASGTTGKYSSVTIGADGLALIAFQDQGSGALQVAHCSILACVQQGFPVPVIATIDASAAVGAYTSSTTGNDGLALIAYADTTNGQLKVAHCNNAACSAPSLAVVDAAAGSVASTSISIGSDGRGLIVYHDATVGQLKIAHCADEACSSAVALPLDTTPGVGEGASVTIGVDGYALVAYYDVTNGNLKVAHLSNVGGLPYVRWR